MNKHKFTYNKSGVNIAAADKFVKFISNISKKNKGNKRFKNIGGFGSFISELAIGMSRPPRIISCGVSPKNINSIGNQEHLRKINKIDKSALIKTISKLLRTL